MLKKKIKKSGATRKKKVIMKQAPLDHVGSSEIEILDFLEKGWPKTADPNIQSAFTKLRSALAKLSSETLPEPATAALQTAAKWQQRAEEGPRYFDPLSLLRRVLMSHDLLFLGRQVTYHIAADASLPRVFADEDQVQFLFAQMIEHLVRRSSRSSRIGIELKPHSLRSGPGIEITFSNTDRYAGDIEQQAFLIELFQGKADEVSKVSISDCRHIAVRQQGQLWVDFPKQQRPEYHLVLPSSEQAAAMQQASQQAFKYDIAISNFANVRKRFGIKKSESLVAQIEHYVKELVRYPIDMVMSLSDKGVITTIYETQRGAAQSVASRISERLGSEIFKIGKRQVDVAFSYHLSPLPRERADQTKEKS